MGAERYCRPWMLLTDERTGQAVCPPPGPGMFSSAQQREYHMTTGVVNCLWQLRYCCWGQTTTDCSCRPGRISVAVAQCPLY